VTLFFGIVGIAFSPIFVRFSELDPTATAFHRVFLALPALWIWMWTAGRSKGATRKPRTASDYGRLILVGVLFAGDLIFWHWSLRYTSVANAVLLANFAPIFVTFGSFVLFGQRFGPAFLVGVALSIGGAAILVGDSVSLGMDNVRGDAFGLVTAIFYGAYILAVSNVRAEFSTATVMGWSSAVSAVILLPITLMMGENVIATTLFGWSMLLGLALVSHVAGQGFLTRSLAYLPAPFTSVALLLQPAISIALAWLILAEPLGGWQALGVAVILVGVVFARLGSR
jgi:drug/metabolite transporter (DMT)-like permease